MPSYSVVSMSAFIAVTLALLSGIPSRQLWSKPLTERWT
jgi:hypothetical protein